MHFRKILAWGALAAASAMATGCGDDTTGSGGGGGSSGTVGDGGASNASTGGPTTGPGPSGSTSSADTSSPASSGNTTAPASSGSGQNCGTGEGTPGELGTVFREYCAIATELANEACGPTNVEECLALEDFFLEVAAGCEAELTASFVCSNALLAAADPASCTCEGEELACPDIDHNACQAETAAAEACDACNG